MDEVGEAIAAAARADRLRVIDRVIAFTRDLDLAEEATQDAFESALEHWPSEGIPDNPAGWLITVARRKALDSMRRNGSLRHKLPLLLVADNSTSSDDSDPLESLRPLFLCCHPALSLESQVALMARIVCGLSTATVARALLVSEATMAARLTRAKKKIREAGVPYRVPSDTQMAERLNAVLAVIYVVYSEGHTATSGATVDRPDISAYASDLAALLARLLPREPEVLALNALILFSRARGPARLSPSGDLVTLEHQDRTLWDGQLNAQAAELLAAARRLCGSASAGPYLLQASIAEVHAQAGDIGSTDWPRIVDLYDQLVALTESPVVELARVVAHANVHGAIDAIRLLDQLIECGGVGRYGRHAAVRAHLLVMCGQKSEALKWYAEAAKMETNETERAFFRRRAQQS